MARRRSVLFIAVAVGAVVGALGVLSASAAPPAEADATSVTQWNLTAASTLAGLPMPAGGAAPATQISMGMVQGAVYDAVNAITPKHHRPYLLTRRFGNTASDEAAVATAAYLVLKNIVETVPQSITFPTRGTVLASLETQYNASKNAIPDSPSKDQGIAAGTAAAQAMIDARQDDGRFGPSQFVPNANPGYWDPVAPNGTTAPDPTPWVGGVEPFLMQSSSQFRSPDPYASNRADALASAAYAADVNEVKAIGGDGVVTPSTRNGRPDVYRQVVAEQPHGELERRRPPAHRTKPSRHFRRRPSSRDGKPRGGGRGHQHLEQQVPLQLLATVSGDPQGGSRRQLRDFA